MDYKSFLITGATSGIGEACARRLAREGATKLLLTGRREDRLLALKKELSSATCTVLTYTFDIRDREAVSRFATTAAAELSTLDVLINNAGLAAGLSDFAHASIDDWEQMIDTNIKGLLYMTRAILPLFMARKSGHIVNIGSVAGRTSYPNGSVYCATKHAVRALNDSLRLDTLGSNIRVTSIDPGMVETEFSLVRLKGDHQKAAAVYQGVRALLADDVADAILWSVSRPAHVNVQEILLMPTDQASVRDVYRRPASI